MSLRSRILLTITLIVFIFLADIVANKLYLYWTYNGLDKVMHLFGGIAAGFFVIGLLDLFHKEHYRLAGAFLGALCVGIVWEIVEYKLHISRYGANFISDTTTDILMDIVGGFTSYILWKHIPLPKK